MPIPSDTKFLTSAGLTVPGSLSDIVIAIQKYHAKTTNREDELYILYKEIEHWLANRTINAFSNRTKENAVYQLKSDVITQFDVEVAGLEAAFTNYNERKARGAASTELAPMQKGYAFERQLYVESGKQGAPLAGSLVKEQMQRSDKNKTGHDFRNITKKDFIAFGQQTKYRMYYLNKIQRLKFQANFNGKDWVDIAGKSLSTGIESFTKSIADEYCCQIYAMDRYGNLFVDYENGRYGIQVLGAASSKAWTAATKARGQANHSSFCSGREVICAGEIFFWKGQLVYLNNSSGHYGPNRHCLHRAVEILRDEGTDLRYLRVGFHNVGYFTADAFLKNSAQPDWPEQDLKKPQNHIFQAKGVQL